MSASYCPPRPRGSRDRRAARIGGNSATARRKGRRSKSLRCSLHRPGSSHGRPAHRLEVVGVEAVGDMTIFSGERNGYLSRSAGGWRSPDPRDETALDGHPRPPRMRLPPRALAARSIGQGIAKSAIHGFREPRRPADRGSCTELGSEPYTTHPRRAITRLWRAPPGAMRSAGREPARGRDRLAATDEARLPARRRRSARRGSVPPRCASRSPSTDPDGARAARTRRRASGRRGCPAGRHARGLVPERQNGFRAVRTTGSSRSRAGTW